MTDISCDFFFFCGMVIFYSGSKVQKNIKWPVYIFVGRSHILQYSY